MLSVAVLVPSVRVLHAQEGPGLFERLNLDKLKLTALGASVGPVAPTGTVPTMAYSLHADYGEISPRWRVVFTATYWGTRYKADVIKRLENKLRESIVDTTRTAFFAIGRIKISDIAVGGDLRWTPRGGALRPYIGGGLLAHVVNVEGKAIQGTFVESALDNIAAGFSAVAGVDVTFARHLAIGVQGRYDLTSGVRYGSLRALGTYHFDTAPGRRGH
jgi:opacity protein-like surface antigen